MPCKFAACLFWWNSQQSKNQSTESADGGGFLNFYKPLDYIASVLSFCSIFLDM